MKVTKKLDICLWFIALAFAIAVASPVWADTRGDKQIVTVGDNMADNSVSISGSRGYGVTQGSFSAAMAQCMASEGRGFFIIYNEQTVVENHHCVGMSLYQMGKYYSAALRICKRTDQGQLYPGGEEECIADLRVPPFDPNAALKEHQETQDVVASFLAAMTAYEEKLSAYEGEIEALKKQAARPTPAPQRTVEQKPAFDFEKLALARAELEKKE